MRLAAGKCRRLLAQADIAQPHALQDAQSVIDPVYYGKQRLRLIHRHRQYVGDGFALVFVFENFLFKALALTDFAGQSNAFQEGEVGVRDA